jgi:hypothetical protein
MTRVIIRPWDKIPARVAFSVLLVALGPWSVVTRDRLDVGFGTLATIVGVFCLWRALRMAVVIDSDGIRVRSFDDRGGFAPWSAISAIECGSMVTRPFGPIYGPIIRLATGRAIVVLPLGSYSRANAERKVAHLRGFMKPDEPSPLS